MAHQRVAATAGWHWLTAGWRLFCRRPLTWMLMAAGLVAGGALLTGFPGLGALGALLFGPALFAGMVHGARELHAGRRLHPLHLLRAFSHSGTLVRTIVLGMIPLIAALVLAVAAGLLLAQPEQLQLIVGVELPGPRREPWQPFAFFALAAALLLAALTLLLFALPRVVVARTPLARGLADSLHAVHDNVGAFLVFTCTVAMLGLLAFVPFGLGFLVLLPVLAGAVHAAHHEVFGDDLRPVTSHRRHH